MDQVRNLEGQGWGPLCFVHLEVHWQKVTKPCGWPGSGSWGHWGQREGVRKACGRLCSPCYLRPAELCLWAWRRGQVSVMAKGSSGQSGMGGEDHPEREAQSLEWG